MRRKQELRFEDLPEILPAYDNRIFQAMLTLPEAKSALISAISAFIDRPVKEVTLRSNVDPIRDDNEKQPIYDINCIIDDERSDQCEIEMQASEMRDDSQKNEHKNIRCRSTFNLARLHAGQAGKGKSYSELSRSYQIMICNYRVFKRNQSPIEHFTLKNENSDELCDAITSIFVDLTQARKIAKKPIGEMTKAEMWLTFIALANNPRYKEIIGEIIKETEGIKVANTTLKSISQNPEQRYQYYNLEKTLQDHEHNMAIDRLTKERAERAERVEAESEKIKKESAKMKKESAKMKKESAKMKKESAKVKKEVAKMEVENAGLRTQLTDKDTRIAELEAMLKNQAENK